MFEGLETQALDDLYQSATTRRVATQAFFFHQDEPAHALYMLLEGRVRLTKVADTGQQLIVRMLQPAEAMGVIAALPQAVYPLSAQATTPCTSLSWPHETLNKLLDRYPLLALRALRLVQQRFAELQTQCLELMTERVERRIARALLRLVNQVGKRTAQGVLIDMPLSRQDVAELTGTTLYTVSRTLSRWEQAGIVALGRERVTICAPHQLVTIADDLLPGPAPD
ncbi:MAG: Crp/Fnr family transcriptional regulator [Chloroflexaceae bacterium]|nr:Crp/Fnr family transcriptional regulator [Chloroflexaceae bacterium]